MTYRLKLLRLQTVPGVRACIALKNYSTIGDNSIISPNCINFKNLENEINKLIKELETIKKQGKKFFEKELNKKFSSKFSPSES